MVQQTHSESRAGHNPPSPSIRPDSIMPRFTNIGPPMTIRSVDNDPVPHSLELTQFAPMIKIYTKIDFPKNDR
jgi:hypothetical protein